MRICLGVLLALWAAVAAAGPDHQRLEDRLERRVQRAGGLPARSHQTWNYDLGGGGWGNGEAETYTNSPDNVFQDGKGNLVIRAIRDASGNYTSARLQTGGPGASTHTADLSWQYGRIEARIKLPFGHGVWPAFWMLGEDFASAGWPACGEIDVMENFGAYGAQDDSSVVNGTAHGPGYASGGLGSRATLPLGKRWPTTTTCTPSSGPRIRSSGSSTAPRISS